MSQKPLPKSHPRFSSLSQRHALEAGVKDGITHPTGLIAFGRGEAFDYLLHEKTHPFAQKAIAKAAQEIRKAKNFVISVNGNTSALCPREIVQLARASGGKLEVNLFYRSEERIKKIISALKKSGAKKVYGLKDDARVSGLASDRAKISSKGIGSADLVLVMLEDGDRTEALRKAGKKVIAVDLNPLSRTARKASITIVDNVVRAIPLLTAELKKKGAKSDAAYNNKKILRQAEKAIRKG
ncbi:4-phosphopantoate--beta-alanine ligase [Candidatus Gugararchaeum adminiculabundum]|nr:4-phosphopantoate--beta-alanine ligase [Candidatus Gugararchaeum adminiculabundum]